MNVRIFNNNQGAKFVEFGTSAIVYDLRLQHTLFWSSHLLSLTLLKLKIYDTYSGSTVCVWTGGACEAQGVQALRVASYSERLASLRARLTDKTF